MTKYCIKDDQYLKFGRWSVQNNAVPKVSLIASFHAIPFDRTEFMFMATENNISYNPPHKDSCKHANDSNLFTEPLAAQDSFQQETIPADTNYQHFILTYTFIIIQRTNIKIKNQTSTQLCNNFMAQYRQKQSSSNTLDCSIECKIFNIPI